MPALLQPVELHITFDLILLNILRPLFCALNLGSTGSCYTLLNCISAE